MELWWKIAPRVLFFLPKQTRISPSHSLKLTGGGGFLGSMRTTLLSTLGGGLKLFFPTCMTRHAHHQHRGSRPKQAQSFRPTHSRWRSLMREDQSNGSTFSRWETRARSWVLTASLQ